MKIAFLVALGILFPYLTFAQVQISEVMYDLPGSDTNEWIEVENVSSGEVDISGWKLFESNVNHSLKIINGTVALSAGGFAVIANDAQAFLAAYPTYSGILYDSAFALSNSGETLVIRDAGGKDIDTVSYPVSVGAAGDGASLQRIGTTWKTGTPTPGSINAESSLPQQEQPANETSTTDGKVTAVYTKMSPVPEEPDPVFHVSIRGELTGTVGSEVEFAAITKEKNLNENRSAIYTWSLGDGSLKYGQTVRYSYQHPGTYVVTLKAEKGSWEAKAKLTLRIHDADMSYMAGDGYFEIRNNANQDVDLSFWRVLSNGTEHQFPEGLVVSAGATTKIPIPGMQIQDIPVLVNQMNKVHIPSAKGDMPIDESSTQQHVERQTATGESEEGGVALEVNAEQLGESDPNLPTETQEEKGFLVDPVLIQPGAALLAVKEPVSIARDSSGWEKFVLFIKTIFK
jgi:hypothetical protein